MNETVKVAHIEAEVRRSRRRKAVDLTVDRGGEVVISVPEHMSQTAIEKVIREKLVWLYSTLGRKEATQSQHSPKEFLSGEGFYYLGRKYRLQLCPPGDGATPECPLLLRNGRFLMDKEFTEVGQRLFADWYSDKAREWIVPKVATLKLRVDAMPSDVDIRDLGYRWGSCGRGGQVHFHWRAVLLPPERVEYLILHELVHLHEHNHSAAFYRRLERACPNHKRHEAWFRTHGDTYAL